MQLEQCLNPIEQRCMAELARIQSENLFRTRFLGEVRKGAFIHHQGHSYLSFNNNDYLGHAQHTVVVEAFKQSAEKYGIGSGGSHLLGGHHSAHKALEEELAEFLGTSKALLFSTGYSANLSALVSLIKPTDYLFQDRLNHASLMDAGRYCQARFHRYRHLDLTDLEKKLASCHPQLSWIVTDGVFSVDGDIAPLNHLAELSKSFQTGLIVDEAHGIGILGKSGQGTYSHFDLNPNSITLLTGSFGIALGTFGAFVAGSTLLIETLIQLARGYIYTTALPPAIAETTRISLKLLKKADDKRLYLQYLIQYFQTCATQLGLKIIPSITPIQPILIGDNLTTLLLAQKLKEAGLLVGAIRPPTVPKNTARLRIALTVHHTKAQIDRLLETIAKQLYEIREVYEAL